MATGTAMGMATATTARLRAWLPVTGRLSGLAVVGGLICIVVTIALASGHVAGAGVTALAAAAFLLLIAWCFIHRRVDRTLLALALYLGLLDGYAKLSTGNPSITLARDVLVVAIASGALVRAARMQQRLSLPPLGGLVVAFVAVVLVEMLNPSARDVAGALAGLRQHLEFVPLFFLGYAFLRRESQLQYFLVVLVLCAALGGVVSYLQSTSTPQELAGWGPGYRERVLGTGSFIGAGRVAFDTLGNTFVRPFGLGSDAGAGATAAALALPALIALLMSGQARLRLLMVPLSVGIALAVATSGSRAALIAVFGSAVAFGILASTTKQALRVVIALAIGTVLLYGVVQELGATNNTSQRAKSISPDNALTTFTAERGDSVIKFSGYAVNYPLGLGIGSVGPAASVGSQSEAIPGLDGETQWNLIVLETGLFGFAVLILLMLRLILLSLVRIRTIQDPHQRLQLAAIAAPLFALGIVGFAGPFTVSAPTAPYMWLVAGVLSYWLITAQRSPSAT